MSNPVFTVLAGPNGAGKSTAASLLLPDGLAFVNADEIAKTLPNFPSPGADVEAGRIAIERMEELERNREDFAVETTLAGRSLSARAMRLKSLGYGFHLIFNWGPSPEFSIARVASRVRMGGHDIPTETIRRRYRAGLRNFFDLYAPLADIWKMFENTSTAGFRMIANGGIGAPTTVVDPDLWTRVLGERDNAR